jgi:hypothetical protein
MPRDPFRSLHKDEVILTTLLEKILKGEAEDLKDTVHRIAFLAARLGMVVEFPIRALVRACLIISDHPDAPQMLTTIGGRRCPIAWAANKHIQWMEDNGLLDILYPDDADVIE